MLERVDQGADEPSAEPLLVAVDFDGTMTVDETLTVLVERFGDPEAQKRAEAELGRGRTLHDVIASGYSSLRASPDEAARWLLENVRFRPGVARFVELVRRRGWRLVIVSSGLRELIVPLLGREGLTGVDLLASSLAHAEGWQIQFATNQRCDVCGEVCKRSLVTSLAGGDKVVYVGDGYSDGCAALTATRIFARRRLAAYLDERAIGFTRFDDFHEIADRLENEFC
jgi:2-hydroxy-3-keto-5-methylthiopentenyl-1-phosphate phosphatase